MKNSKLQHTHKHLTLVFTWVTFCIILIIAGSFLAARYFNESRLQKREMLIWISSISRGLKNDTNFLQKYKWSSVLSQSKKFSLHSDENRNNQRGQLSFFVLNKQDDLIFEQQLQKPRFSRVDFSSPRIYRDNQTLVATRVLDNYKVIFYQNARYSWEDILRDFLLLLFLVTLISGGIYFIWYRFVWQALGPVEESMKDMSDFTHNAGHELKTPLAVVRGNLQILLAEKQFDKKLAKKSITQIDEMTDLIDWLRDISELGKLADLESINLPKEVQKIVENLEKLSHKNWVTLHWIFPEKFIIKANKQELDIFLSNIIKNAIIYNKKGWKVDILMQKNILTIKDTWVGMTREQQEKIFDRLYRADTSRNTQGFGIWLSLVSKIAEANNWKLHVESTPGEWTSFEIVF